MYNKGKILLYGYGNPGRQDDGLGDAFIQKAGRWIREKGIRNIELESNYQLNIEDAEAIANKDLVLFIDASSEQIEDISITRVEPSGAHVEFTMHASSPAFILALCNNIYNKMPETWLLHIRGYQWNLKEELTAGAKKNLDTAFEYITGKFLKEESTQNIES